MQKEDFDTLKKIFKTQNAYEAKAWDLNLRSLRACLSREKCYLNKRLFTLNSILNSESKWQNCVF